MFLDPHIFSVAYDFTTVCQIGGNDKIRTYSAEANVLQTPITLPRNRIPIIHNKNLSNFLVNIYLVVSIYQDLIFSYEPFYDDLDIYMLNFHDYSDF